MWLRLRVARFWMPASGRQQPTQRRRPAHTSSERRRSTLCRDPTHRNRHGEYLANLKRLGIATTSCPWSAASASNPRRPLNCPPLELRPSLLGTRRAQLRARSLLCMARLTLAYLALMLTATHAAFRVLRSGGPRAACRPVAAGPRIWWSAHSPPKVAPRARAQDVAGTRRWHHLLLRW